MTKNSRETIDKRPDAKEYIKDYWSKRAPGFARLRKSEIHSSKYDQWEQEILRQLPQKEHLKILDVGCGAGFFSILLARHGHQVTGIDVTKEMISEASALAKEEHASAVFQVMDAEKLDFPDGFFDVVTARNLTWNLPHPAAAYAEWLRVLKPGGRLLNYDGEHARDHHHQQLPKHNAHQNVSGDLLEQCHTIYHMLDISLERRPAWDLSVLKELNVAVCQADEEVGRRIYQEQDIFYIPVPIFLVRAEKGMGGGSDA